MRISPNKSAEHFPVPYVFSSLPRGQPYRKSPMEVITVFRLLGCFAESLVGLQEPASAHPLRLTKEWRVEQTSHHGRTRCDFRWDLPKLPVSSDLKSICRCSIYRYIDRIDVSALRLVLTLVWPCTVCSGSPSFRLALFAFIFSNWRCWKLKDIFLLSTFWSR